MPEGKKHIDAVGKEKNVLKRYSSETECSSELQTESKKYLIQITLNGMFSNPNLENLKLYRHLSVL